MPGSGSHHRRYWFSDAPPWSRRSSHGVSGLWSRGVHAACETDVPSPFTTSPSASTS